MVGILDRHASAWIDAQQLGGLQERIGMRLVARIVAVRGDAVEPIGERVPPQMTLDGGARRAGGDGARQPQLVEEVEEFPHAGHAFLNDVEAGPRALRPLFRVMGIGPDPESAPEAWQRIEDHFAQHLKA